jgi:hypothetical protein
LGFIFPFFHFFNTNSPSLRFPHPLHPLPPPSFLLSFRLPLPYLLLSLSLHSFLTNLTHHTLSPSLQLPGTRQSLFQRVSQPGKLSPIQHYYLRISHLGGALTES